MARVAEYVIAVEEGADMPTKYSVDYHEFRDLCALGERMGGGLLRDGAEDTGAEEPPAEEDRMVSSVSVKVDGEARSVDVQCGWFTEDGGWRYEAAVLNY